MTVSLYQTPTPLPFDAADFAALDATLGREGFTAGPPADLPDDALGIDARTAGEMECEFCGAAGGAALAAFHSADEYRCFAICCVCGSPTEF